jgi:hypothetical protein
MSRRLVSALSLLILCLSAAPAHAAVSRPYRSILAKGISGATAVDGGHLVAWGGGKGRLALYDDRSNDKTLTFLDRPCNSVSPLDGSAGVFLVNCGVETAGGVETRQLVFDSASSEVTDVAGTPANSYEQIGQNWLQGTTDSGGDEVVIYTNWHTGETRTENSLRFGAIRTPFDLDSPNLDAIAPAAVEFVVGSSMALEQVRSGTKRRYSMHLMDRIGDKRIANCSRPCSPVSLKGGLAMWGTDAGKLYGYGIQTKRFREWNMSDTNVVRGSTSRRVYFLTPKLSSPQFFDLRSFRWR